MSVLVVCVGVHIDCEAEHECVCEYECVCKYGCL